MPPQVQLIGSRDLLKVVKTATKVVCDEMKDYAFNVAAAAGKKLTCTPGCAECCYQKILTSAGEGLAIYFHLREQKRWTKEMKQKLEAADRELTDYDHFTWFDLKEPCVFLAETSKGRGSCTIYETRPVSCGATFSASGDPILCAEVGGRHGQFQINHTGPSMLLYMKLIYQLKIALDTEGGQHFELMTLPGAVLWAGSVFEGEPPPKVHRVVMSREGAAAFDAIATHKQEVEEP